MKIKLRKIIALTLTFIMLLGIIPIDVLAGLITTDYSEGFGIKGIVNPPVNTRTYTFVADGVTVDTQIVKDGEYLTEPQAPEKEGHRFAGWFVGSQQLLFGPANPITVTQTEAITATARFEQIYYVFFMDSAGATGGNVFRTKSGTTGEQVSTGDVKLPIGSTHAVTGWYTNQNLTGSPVGENFTIGASDQQLWPKIEEGNYIYFIVGAQATYIEPQFVPPADVTQEPAAPTRPGYTFSHWSLTEGGAAYSFGNTISSSITLYAVWTKNTNTPYTVIFWKQSVNDSKNLADSAKTYDFAEAVTRYGTTESPAAPTTADGNKNYTGFHYNSGKSAPVVIEGDGSSTLNIYYDRNLLTLIFQGPYPYPEVDRMTGLYGQTLAQNGETWPAGTIWREYTNGSNGPRLTFLDAFIFDDLGATQTTYPKDTLTLRNDGNEGGNYYIRHYKQNLEGGDYPTTPTNENRSGGGGSFTFTNKYTGFTVAYYRRGDTGNWVAVSPGQTVYYGYRNLYVRHERNSYDLAFYNHNATSRTESLKFESKLNSFYNYVPPKPAILPDEFVFQGWYKDTAFTEPFNFLAETMPAASLMIYAKWSAPVLDAIIHLSMESGSTTVTFPLVYNEPLDPSILPTVKDSNGNVVWAGDPNTFITMPANREWIGWSTKVNGDYINFNFNTLLTQDIELYPYYVSTERYTVTYNSNGGTGTVVDNKNYAQGAYADVQPGAVTPPDSDNQVFLGWTLEGDASGKIYVSNDRILIDGNKTLVAAFGPKLMVTLTYKPNEGDGSDQVFTFINNTSHTIIENPSYTRAGYQFIGWNTYPDGSGFSYKPGQTVIVDNTVPGSNVLYAHWEKLITVMAFKEWVLPTPDFPKPAIWFTLYRDDVKVEGSTREVPLAPAIGLATWENMPETDGNGHTYVYSVKETDADGNDYTPPSYSKVEDGILVKNTYEFINFTANKVWAGDHLPEVKPTIQVQLQVSAGGGPYVNTGNVVTMSTATSHSWYNLPKEDAQGRALSYRATEVTVPESYTVSYEHSTDGKSTTITNTYQSVSFAVTKLWVDDNNMMEPGDEWPSIELQLYQNGVAYGPYIHVEAQPQGSDSFNHSWEGLPKYKADGVSEHVYTVRELVVPRNYAMTAVDTESESTITNSLRSDSLTGTKYWDGGPPTDPGATVTLQLYQAVEGQPPSYHWEPWGDPVPVSGPNWQHTWTGMPIQGVVGGQTVTFKYDVEEDVSTVPENYEYDAVSSASLYVTNTSQITSFTAQKLWKDGPRNHPDVTLYLERSSDGSNWSRVADTDYILTDLDLGTHTWTGLTRFATWDADDLANRVEYIYRVQEEAVENYIPTYPDNNTVHNQYVIPTRTIAISKIWSGGPTSDHVEPALTLWRRFPDDSTVPVAGNEYTLVKTGPSSSSPGNVNTTEYTFTYSGLASTDIDGNPLLYGFTEAPVAGYTTIYSNPYNLGGTLYALPGTEQEPSTITNSYEIPMTASLSATKQWVGGPDADHTRVKLSIWRTIDDVNSPPPGGITMEAGEWFQASVNPPDGISNTFVGTWSSLAATDINGNPYTYFFTEDDHPRFEHYERAYSDYITVGGVQYAKNGETVTNTYVPPTDGSATASKQWVNGHTDQHVPVALTLYRSTDYGATMEAVPGNPTPVATDNGSVISYAWSNLQRTDGDGIPYQFYFTEDAAALPEGYALSYSSSVTVGGTEYAPSGATAYNTYTPVKISVTAVKNWVNGPDSDHVVVPLTLHRKIEGGSLKPVAASYTVSPEGPTAEQFTYTWTGVDKTDINGNIYTYYFKENEVAGYTRAYESVYENDYGLADTAVANEYIQPTGTVSGTKRWVFVHEDALPDVWMQLNRSTNANGIDMEPVPGIDTILINSSTPMVEDPDTYGTYLASFSWDDIQLKSPAGEDYYFFVKEVDADGNNYTPEFFTKVESGTHVQNTYMIIPAVYYTPPQFSKVLSGRELQAGEFEFELIQEFTDKNGNKTEIVIETVANEADGSVPFSDIPVSAMALFYTPTGYVREKIPADADKEPGMSYDTKSLIAHITVTDNGVHDGQLNVSVTYSGDLEFDSATNHGKFNNSYAASGELEGGVWATKKLAGRDLKANEFTFQLKDSDGAVLQSKKNAADGSISFGKIDFDQDDIGLNTFTITELVPDPAEIGMDYDPMVLTFTVEVTDAGSGVLNVSAPTFPTDTEFNNTYTASGSFTPQVSKTLSGRDLKADEFSFQLKDSDGVVIQTKKNAANGNVIFDAISYTQADIGKTYTYTVNEVAPTENGITHDTMEVTITVTVADAGNGVLTVTPSYSADTEFNNTYTASGSLAAGVWAKKELAGRELKADEFEFKLRDSANTVIQTKKNAANGNISFDAIDYTQADIGKTYTYTIKEAVPIEPETGITYDPMTLTFTVAVTDAGNGVLTATPSYPADTVFNNTYAASGSFTPQVTKTLSGRALKADEFEFELKAGATVLQSKKNDIDGKVTFNAISYSQADIGKTFYYTITEKAPTESGMTHDTMTVTITVTVADAGNGNLTVTPSYSADTEFNNTYTASGSFTAQVTKALAGRTLTADEFSFELKNSDGDVLQTKENAANGNVTFDAISYTQADIGKTYNYKITEKAPTESGMTHDTMEVTIAVTVTDGGNGVLTVTPSYSADTEFNNTYAASGSFTPQVSKTLSGRTLKANEFSFELKDSDGDVLQTKENAANGNVIFDAISYTQADIDKTYSYTITEVAPSESGITYDTMVVTITVEVTDAGNGVLTVSPVYSADTEFNNTYTASGSLAAGAWATKELSGRALKANEFEFKLRNSANTVIQTKRNDIDGNITFDAIPYTQADIGNTYTYTITEVDDGETGMTYDDMTLTFTVAVTDAGNGVLTVTPSYPDDTVFNNSYVATGSFAPQASKALAGRTLKANEFEFQLKDSDGVVLQTKKNAQNGNIIFDEISYSQADIGKTYTYTIKEVIPSPSEAWMTYDTMEIEFTVKVTDAGNGNLTVTPSYPADTVFNNTYAASGSFTAQVTKALAGRALKADEFSFQLKDSNGVVLQTKENAADGSITFDAIAYTQADIGETYTYTINEVVPTTPETGMTYDTMVITIPVTVTDGGGGVLIVTPSYPADKEFNNTYAATGSFTPQVTKTLSGRTLKANEFEFQLKDSNGTLLQTKKNAANGSVIFDAIGYTQADIGETYTYTITEVAPSESGITYDTMVVTITVTVTDAGNGNLTVSPVYSDDTEFNNTYTASGSLAAGVWATKMLSGRTLKANEFEFQLKNSANTVIQTKRNDVDGKISFDAINYTQDDIGKTYTYTITEVKPYPAESGMSYDTMVLEFDVTVEDAGNGKLTVTPSYPADTVFNNSYVASGELKGGVWATKNLVGRELKADDFNFELKRQGSDTVIQTVANAADGKISFAAIPYTQADIGETYTYTIKEVVPATPETGMTYDPMTLTFTVTVTDDGNGKLTATPAYPDDTEFNNTYVASGSLAAGAWATKALAGRELKAEEFEFELRDSNGVLLQTKENAANGNISFDAIEYDQDDIGNTYTYRIKEVVPTEPETGMTYDPMTLTFTVAVTDAGNGNLTVTPSYPADTVFNNTYAATGSFAAQVTKALAGRTLKADEFSFQLKNSDGVVLRTKQNAADGSITFDAIAYTQADIGKTYTYRITEVVPTTPEGGMTYDSMTVTVSVKVEDAGGGGLKVTPSYSADTEFNNSYAATGSFTPQVTKTLSGRTLKADDFSFQLKDSNGDVLQTKENAADGSVIFNAINYTQADIDKTYTYTIKEVVPATPETGMTYDTMEVTITVTVTDAGNGNLTVSPVYSADTEFNNTYTASGELKSGAWASKVLTGRALTAGEFSFELKLKDNANVIQTKSNALDGSITFDAIPYTQADIGKTYTYTITEVKPYPAEGGMSYDTMVLEFDVTVEDAGNGKLTVTPSYPADTVFNNTYTASGELKSGAWATKVLTGRALTAGEFSFELKLKGSSDVIQTKSNALDGSITFDAIPYTQADIGKTYTYTITEVDDGEGGMTYDPMTLEFDVTVEDAGGGKLTVTPSYPADTEFNNNYVATGSFTPQVTKALSGRALKAGEFSFELKDSNGTVLQTDKQNAANGNVIFDAINYTQADIGKSYTYTINETVPSPGEDGMAYDTGALTVTVTVTDAGNGVLSVTPAYPAGTEFSNVFTPNPGMEISKNANKTKFTAVGEEIEYTVVVTNTGNIPLEDVTVSDTLFTLTDTMRVESKAVDGVLEVGETWTYEYTYTTGQLDMDAGKVVNTAKATNPEFPDNDPENPPPMDSLEILGEQKIAMTVTKSADKTSYSAVGEIISYTVMVKNTGNIAQTGVQFSDSLVGISTPTLTEGNQPGNNKLDVDETWTYTYTYTVTQDDLDAGSVKNLASVRSSQIPNPVTAEHEVPAEQNPAMTVKKTVDESEFTAVGEVLHYKVVIENTGNITLKNVVVTDSMVTLTNAMRTESVTPADGILQVGETWTYEYTYRTTQADMDRGYVTNAIKATNPQLPDGDPNNPPPGDEETILGVQDPSASIDKVANIKNFAAPGTVTYTYTVRNTGNVTLTNVGIYDNKLGWVPLNKTTIEVGGSARGTVTYRVTQADIDRGGAIVNIATVTARQDIPLAQASETVTITQYPGMAIAKRADKDQFTKIGEMIIYTVTLTNIGNVTLDNVVLTDSLVDLDSEKLLTITETKSYNGRLDVGETWIFRYPYLVTREDFIEGSIVNAVKATNPLITDSPNKPAPSDELEITIKWVPPPLPTDITSINVGECYE